MRRWSAKYCATRKSMRGGRSSKRATSDGDGGERDRDADQGGHSRCRSDDPGSRRRRRPLCGARVEPQLRRIEPHQTASGGLCRPRGTSRGRASRTAARNRGAEYGDQPVTDPSPSDSLARIADTVKSNDIVLFMKGTALFPQCGFSSRAIAILDRLGAKYETVDVLQDPEVRQGIKEYSEWPTIPQLYVKGEFVGGSDIMMEMFESGELQQMLGAEA